MLVFFCQMQSYIFVNYKGAFGEKFSSEDIQAGAKKLSERYGYFSLIEGAVADGRWNGLKKTPLESAKFAPLYEVLPVFAYKNEKQKVQDNYYKIKK
jgi:hypothetical protein